MDWHGWLTLAVVDLALLAVARELAGPDLILMARLFTLAGAGVLTPDETFDGFANEAVATVGALFVLAAALRESGALEVTFGRIFGRTRQERLALVRMSGPVAASCGFASPIGYQTHLIVDGPGGYRFTDFVRVGLPLEILCGLVAVTVIPWMWPF